MNKPPRKGRAKKTKRQLHVTVPKPVEEATVNIKCVYPPCTEKLRVKAPPPGVEPGSPAHLKALGSIPMCNMHGSLLKFYIWLQTNVKVEQQRTGSGLILPGHQKFDAKLTDAKPWP